MDSGPGPSRPRPPPLPYDDPYADEPLGGVSDDPSVESQNVSTSQIGPRRAGSENYRGRGQGRGRGRGGGRGRESGGRGRVSDRGWSVGEGSSGGPHADRRGRRQSFRKGSEPASVSSSQRSLSPTSLAIARATGQGADGPMFAAHQSPPSLFSPLSPTQNYWEQHSQSRAQPQPSYGHQQMQTGQHQSHNQPHINPRFAPFFGIDTSFMQSQQYGLYPGPNSFVASPYSAHTPTGPWTVNNWQHNATEGPQPDEYRP